MEAAIKQALQRIEEEQQVRIIYACEAGSRAWGIASKDSDYDVRFIYVRPKSAYLSLDVPRDVIELPISNGLDVSGWDIYKALWLLRKSNSSFFEWLFSPVIYLERSLAIQDMRDLAQSILVPRIPLLYHYSRMAESNYKKYIEDRYPVPLKKYLYALRPLTMLLYIEQHNGEMPPTINFPAILASVQIANDIQERIGTLIERKQTGEELGMGKPDAILNLWIEDNIARWKTHTPSNFHDPVAMRKRTEAVLRRVIDENNDLQWASSEMVQEWQCQRCEKPQKFFDVRRTVWLTENDIQLNICAKCHKELTRTNQIAKEAL